MVTKADIADVYLFDGTEGVVFPVAPDPNTWPRIWAAWDEFAAFVATKSPPPLVKGDVHERGDPEWAAAAAAFLDAKRAADIVSKNLDEAKASLVALADHASVSGGGVTVTRFWKSGAVEYKKIRELQALDLEQYRGPAREEVRVAIGR